MKSALNIVSMLSVLSLANIGSGNAAGIGKFGGGNIYVGLNYSPAFSRISDFEIGESTGSTAAVYPYYKDGTEIQLKAIKFDWSIPNPKVQFRDNPILAMEGSVGYSIGSARVELEVGYEQFKPRGVKYTGAKEEEGDTLYLLAKRLPHYYVTEQFEKFHKALADTTPEEIATFAQVVGHQEPGIDKKVCGGNKVNSGSSYECDWDGSSASAKFSEFGAAIKANVDKWPHHIGSRGTNSYWVAVDLSKLSDEEKWRIADMLSTTISGAEVVEIRAVSTTSVMLNACYDLMSEGFGIVPYACLGVGANFVGIVDGHVTPKLSYKVKAGLSYALSPEISVFAGGFYHRILGEGEYDDLPVQRLVDDITTNKTKEFAKASFKMAYTGAEIGVRFAF